MPKRHHRLVAYRRGSVAEARASCTVPWASAHEVAEVVGALPDGDDPWLSTGQAAAILEVLGAEEDPAACDWCLHEADRPEGSG